MKKVKVILVSLLATISILGLSSKGINAEWKQSESGWWYAEGNSYITGWKKIDSEWYYFNNDGYMKKGWVYDKGTWYYLGSNGAMQTGINEVNGKTYYFDSNGAMKTGNIIDHGKTVGINLVGNPTTGYTWQYKIDSEGIIKEDSQHYKQDNVNQGIVGAGGLYNWRFSALKEGKTEVVFKYCRPWENNEVEAKTYIFTVDKKLNIVVEQK